MAAMRCSWRQGLQQPDRQGGDGGDGGGGEGSRGWEGMESYGLVVLGDGAGDDGRTSVEGLLFVVRTRMWRGCGVLEL